MSGTKVTLGFGNSSPVFPRAKSDHLAARPHEVEPCSPEMEGPIALVAPELPEDTLMEVGVFPTPTVSQHLL